MALALGVIPARGGSKGIVGKNIRPLLGKPLMVWTIDVAKSSKVLDRVIVSTEDPEIARIAREAGAEVPFIRPSELARDDTADLPVCEHALNWLAEQEDYLADIVVWLRPTSPLRRPGDIESSVDILCRDSFECVRSVTEVKHHPYWMKKLQEGRLVPLFEGHDERLYYQRQLCPPVYQLNGAVDVIWSKNVGKYDLLFWGDMGAYVMDAESSMDIDNEHDLAQAELLLRRRMS